MSPTMMDADDDTEEGQTRAANAARRKMQAAAMDPKARGNMPGEAADVLISFAKPKVNWRNKIRLPASAIFSGRYTFNKPDRKGQAMGIRLPSRQPTKKGLVCVLDTSLSISNDEISRFMSEINGIFTQCGCKDIFVICHDAVPYLAESFNENTLKSLTSFERGGTSHKEVFQVIEGDHPTLKGPDFNVGMVLFFTDMASVFPESASFPCIWAVPSSCYREGMTGPGVPGTNIHGITVEIKD